MLSKDDIYFLEMYLENGKAIGKYNLKKVVRKNAKDFWKKVFEPAIPDFEIDDDVQPYFFIDVKVEGKSLVLSQLIEAVKKEENKSLKDIQKQFLKRYYRLGMGGLFSIYNHLQKVSLTEENKKKLQEMFSETFEELQDEVERDPPMLFDRIDDDGSLIIKNIPLC